MAAFFSSFCFAVIACAAFFFLPGVRPQNAGGRPHGLDQENPMYFSPAAFEFFHPDAPCVESDCAPLAAFVKPMATQVLESSSAAPHRMGGRLGARAAVGIVFGSVFVVALAMGVYYVAVKRRANLARARTIQPGV